MEDLILHEDRRSGNCYKIRLTAAHVGAAHERREYDNIAVSYTKMTLAKTRRVYITVGAGSI
jgi:hypothetical protein